MKQLNKNISKKKTFLNHRFDLSTTNRRFSLVFFTTITSFLFLNFFEPFGLYYDKATSSQDVFVELFVAITFAFVILIITQFVLRPLFSFFRSSIWGIIVWFLLEAVLVGFTWSLLETYLSSNITSFLALWLENIVAFIVVMFLPYFLFIGYIFFKDRLQVVEQAERKTEELENTLSLKDESGEVKLICNADNLLLIKSADNYVEVYHLENSMPKKILIRNTIKKFEEELQNTHIIRCHRSYMLNTRKIDSARKTTSGFDVKILHVSEITIPVSRSYVSELKKYTK